MMDGMKIQNYYLLDDTPESRAMTEKLKSLVSNGEESNLNLAFQLLRAGGVPQELFTQMTVLAKFHPNTGIRKDAESLFKKFCPEDLKNFVKTNWKNKYRSIYNEKVLKDILSQICEHPVLDKEIFGKMIYKIHRRGVKFCIESPEIENLWILREILEEDTISLENLELSALPPEISRFPQLKHLNINGNQFEMVADILQELKALESLTHEHTPLKESEIIKLQNQFPLIYAKNYFDKGNHHYYYAKYTEAIIEFDKSLEIHPGNAEVWNMKGYCYRSMDDHQEATECFEESIALDNQNALFHANLAEALCSLKEYHKSIEICGETLDKFQSFAKGTQLDESNLWFIKGLANFWLKEYEQSIEDNNRCIQLNNYAGAWYNKACSYSKLNQKQEMLDSLEESMKMEDEYVEMAEKDVDRDFDTFYEDADFIALRSKYVDNF